MDKNELQHWGIKGMKWGKRRYQNSDGSLTEAGKKRYNKEADEQGYDRYSGQGARYKEVGKGKDKRNEVLRADVDKYVREDMSNAKQTAELGSNLARQSKAMLDKYGGNEKRVKMDLSNMTDKQMRDEINRAMLERQYNDMFAPRKVNKGKEYVGKAFAIGADALAVTGTALGIALSIKALSGK